MPNAEDYMVDPVTLEGDAPLSKAVGLLRNQRSGAHVVVTEDGRYVGVIDDRALRRFQGDLARTKAATVASTARKLARDSPPEDIVEAFLNSEAKAIPVLERGKAVGVVPRAAALKILMGTTAIQGRRVEELMTRPPVTVGEETTIAEAERAMRGNGIYRLVVVDKRGRLAGVVSSYDFAIKVKAGAKASRREATFRPGTDANVQEEPVSSVMTPVPNVATVRPDAMVRAALQAMLQKGLSNLVVTREDKPVGMFTARDALETVATIPRQNIFVFGLRKDELSLRPSIVDEATAFAERVRKSAPLDYVTLHLHSTPEGQKRRWEVRARVSINGHLHTAGTPDLDPHRKAWDAGMAVREALDEVLKEFYKHEKRRPRGERFERNRYTQEG
jgi:CBS domain-containing protein